MKKATVAILLCCIFFLSISLLLFGGCGNEKIEINSADDLFDMKEGKCYSLTCDIDLQGKSWTPLNVNEFDGQGHTISNFSVNSPAKCNYSANGSYYSYSFLGNCRWFENVTLSDINIVANREIDDDMYLAFGVGLGEHIENVKIKNSSITQSTKVRYCGGVVGRVLSQQNEIKNCIVKNCSLTASKTTVYFGGIVAEAEKTQIKNCLTSNFLLNGNETFTAGGIAGSVSYTEISGCTAINNTLIADLVGGIVGISSRGNNQNISACNSQENSFEGQSVGGIVGSLRDGRSVVDCLSYKNSFTTQNDTVAIGGIAGYNKGVIRSCLSMQNRFKATYKNSLKLSTSVADNGTVMRFIGIYQNDFNGADKRNVITNNEEQEIVDNDIFSLNILAEKFKLDKNLWSITEGELPKIKNIYSTEGK